MTPHPKEDFTMEAYFGNYCPHCGSTSTNVHMQHCPVLPTVESAPETISRLTATLSAQAGEIERLSSLNSFLDREIVEVRDAFIAAHDQLRRDKAWIEARPCTCGIDPDATATQFACDRCKMVRALAAQQEKG